MLATRKGERERIGGEWLAKECGGADRICLCWRQHMPRPKIGEEIAVVTPGLDAALFGDVLTTP